MYPSHSFAFLYLVGDVSCYLLHTDHASKQPVYWKVDLVATCGKRATCFSQRRFQPNVRQSKPSRRQRAKSIRKTQQSTDQKRHSRHFERRHRSTIKVQPCQMRKALRRDAFYHQSQQFCGLRPSFSRERID